MSVHFDCPSGATIEPSEHLSTVVKELQWEEGGDEVVALSLVTKVYGRVKAVNDCNIEAAGLVTTGVLQSLTQLNSLDLHILDNKNQNSDKKDQDEDNDEDEDSLVLSTDDHGVPTSLPHSPRPDMSRRLLFMQVADGPLGLDLRAAAPCDRASMACGGLQVTAVYARSEFRPGDVFTACNGVSLVGLGVEAAIAVLVQGSSRDVVVLRNNPSSFSPLLSTAATASAFEAPSRRAPPPASRSTDHDKPTRSTTTPPCSTLIKQPVDTPNMSCGGLHLHWLWRAHAPPLAQQSKLSAYSLYVCSSAKRAADRASFDYIPGLD
mmetsp:Transcript_15746/g.26282  ORF Transcript_15746/g.26282 Transcript_15746/m.26282 type:complete len:321 (-) Transcript_15746:155-1117(-)|eukprot:CAMPEP_0114429802 /NCGR_PEP_ID=MMETSP0103-20121206/9687_1 /TAXON_ID=37642 ORGANISM="Paraphysomonas imperforata, Strain PA2" /NCGR_SAMPLE_ID=MMETSP0103 /ASSEMBLY_ACC=CAM_ASM_000201 /LENGTH=320 /DNA_ID=CAMNT_0001599177 /DNA_START=54 /DNA_END=1016 /DNA_ORIENTATION=-